MLFRSPSATFLSIECRLTDFRAFANALADSTPGAPTLRTLLGKARDLERSGLESCRSGDVRATRRALKRTFLKLGRVRAVLGAKRSKTLPGRDQLRADLKALRLDVRSLKGNVSCPSDAAADIGNSLRSPTN